MSEQAGDEQELALAPGIVEALAKGEMGLREILGVSNESIESVIVYGYRTLAEGYFEVAKQVFEGLIALEPRVAYFQIALGAALKGLGDRKGAWEAWEEAIKRDPQDVVPRINQAEMLLEDNRRAEAQQILNQVRKMDPKGENPFMAKANELLLQISQLNQMGI